MLLEWFLVVMSVVECVCVNLIKINRSIHPLLAPFLVATKNLALQMLNAASSPPGRKTWLVCDPFSVKTDTWCSQKMTQ